jgi:Ca2+-binding RTX toxin-like protein
MFRNRSRSCAFESLETRRLMAADVKLNGDILNIRGTTHNDTIDVQRVASGPNSGMVQVTLNGKQTLFNDNFNGSTGSISRVVIRGRGGNDQISVAENVGFQAFITGGRGSDTISGGSGSDTIDGGRGSDNILGNDGDDSIIGGRGNDHIDAGGGNDNCTGSRGNDSLDGGDGKDTLNGDAGNDQIQGDKGQDQCFGGAGSDRVFGGSQDDLVDGGDGNDDLSGDSGKDVVFGQLGDDRLNGGDDNDHLDGGLGNDNVLGGAGDDQLKGGLGLDALDGQEGFNLLDNEPETEILLNGLVTDLDREFFLNFATGGPNSFAKFDLQNDHGQVVEKLTVQAHGLVGQSSFDLLVGGIAAVQVPVDSNGDAFVEYSSDPSGSQLPFPLSFPTLQGGPTIGASSGLAGTIVQKFVI